MHLPAFLTLLGCVGLSPQAAKDDTGSVGLPTATTPTTPEDTGLPPGTTPPTGGTTPPTTGTTSPPTTGTTPPTGGTTTTGGTTATTPPITLAVDRVEPAYGTNAGGVQVRVTGGPYDASAEVWFGADRGAVIATSATTIDVLTPASAAVGPVDVRVTTGAGSGALPGGFQYFADATGEGGVFGAVEWYELLGGYWTPGSTDFGAAWLYFVDPQPFHFWDDFAPGTDSCASNYAGLSLSLRDLGVGTVTLSAGARTVSLPWDAAAGAYSVDLSAADYQQNTVYDLEPVAGGTYPTFDVPSLTETPTTFNLTQPNLSTGSLPSLTRAQLDFRWNAAAGDRILLLLLRYDATQTILKEVVSCVAANDGAFDVPTGTWSGWDRGDILLIAVGNAQETGGVVPLDASESRVAGIYWLLGGASAN